MELRISVSSRTGASRNLMTPHADVVVVQAGKVVGRYASAWGGSELEIPVGGSSSPNQLPSCCQAARPNRSIPAPRTPAADRCPQAPTRSSLRFRTQTTVICWCPTR